MKVHARNKKALFNYTLEEKFSAGMVLKGWQVKSIKTGKASIKESYAYIKGNEAFLKNAQISAWPGMGDLEKQQQGEDIKLLLNKQEIGKLLSKLQTKGLTLIPTAIVESRGLLKLELALAKGKKTWDKRATIKEREAKRDVDRELKQQRYF
jgi:SsrA-binding protein